MIGVPNSPPKTPGFVIVNVPPCTSSGLSLFVRARSARSFAVSRELRQRQRVGISDHRNDQSPIESDRHSEIDIALVNDLVAVDLRIDDAMLADRGRHRLEDERHERQLRAVLRLELVLIGRAELRDIRHVDLVNARHMGRRLLRERHVLGDLLSHHRHFLDAVLRRRDRCGGVNVECRLLRADRSSAGSAEHP